jgi:hypothetical protein
MSDTIALERWTPGQRGKGLITFDSSGQPRELELFNAPLDPARRDSEVMVHRICDHLGLEMRAVIDRSVRVVRVETRDGADRFRIDGVDWISPSPDDAELISWVSRIEPRISPATAEDYERDPSLRDDQEGSASVSTAARIRRRFLASGCPSRRALPLDAPPRDAALFRSQPPL